ncbi:MAG: UPF0182 family protein [Microthrixaceae bacterium]|nr:UPF0182 family protein [Microthrixaceae bacterium]
MRNPDDIPRPQRRAQRPRRPPRTWVIVVVVAIVALVLSAQTIARFYTDFLWFDALGQSVVWRTELLTKVALALVFAFAFFLLLFVNLVVADRVAPPFALASAEDEVVLRYRELVGPRQRAVRVGIALVFAMVVGFGASSQWQSWLLFRNGGEFGLKDSFLGRDVGFYLFDLPFLSYLSGWAFAAVLITTIIVGAIHYLNGGIRVQVGSSAVSPQVKIHLSVLLALMAFLKAADYLLKRSQLLFSERGYVRGATYTDVNAQDPAIKLLILISLLSGVLFLVNIAKRGWTLPVVAVALWAVISVVAGAIYPWFIESFQVSRKQSAREAPYIQRNILATRDAFGLSKIVEQNFDYASEPTSDEVAAGGATISNIRLLDPKVSSQTFHNLQSQLSFYRFATDLDVDRYPINPDGSNVEVVLAARELNPDTDLATTWESRHLIYTHGYGVALAPANAVTSEGLPDFKVSGASPISVASDVSSVLKLSRPEIYFGEGIDGAAGDGYAIVGTTRKEKSAGVDTAYEGKGGVRVKGLLRRAAFYLRFGDLEALTSDYLTSKSRILYNRDVEARVRELAPFLKLDSDPYPVVVGGRIKYIVDGYTTASTYPYAELADTSQVAPGADLAREPFNYVRNSVKAVVDAYDGTVALYLSDTLYGGRDPVIRAYAKAFPGLFIEKVPDEIKAHLRYPEDLFRVQTAMWGRYHQDSASAFFEGSDRWDVAQDPGNSVRPTEATGSRARVEPYYLQMRVPGDENERFVLFRPFVPHSTDDSKKQLTSFMLADSDPEVYGRLQVFTLTSSVGEKVERNRDVDGPLTVNSRILSSREGNISQELTLLNQGEGGSKVQLGNLLMVPLGRSILYVRPVYVSASSADSAPELRLVIVADGERTEVGTTLREALTKLYPDVGDIETREGTLDQPQPDDDPATEPAPDPETAEDPAEMLKQALGLFAEADTALKEGGATSLQEYADKNAEAAALVERAHAALASGGSDLPANPASTPTSTSSSTTSTTAPPATTTTGKA